MCRVNWKLAQTGMADVFAVQNDGSVQAITSDGITAWTVSLSPEATLVPDFQGGLVVADSTESAPLEGI